jgi:signal recognition particle receptor subunit beta
VNFRYVVDAADAGKLDASKREFKALLDKPQLSSIPILVLGNKNDLSEALTAEQLIQALYDATTSLTLVFIDFCLVSWTE